MFIILSLIVTNALILAHLYRTKIDMYEVRLGGVINTNLAFEKA